MTGRHSGFIALCKADPNFATFLNDHCIIHQQAICSEAKGFDHVMTPVVKIINSIRAKAKQHRSFKLFLEECSAENGDLLFHTKIRWLSRGKILQRFLPLLSESKAFMESREEDTTLLSGYRTKQLQTSLIIKCLELVLSYLKTMTTLGPPAVCLPSQQINVRKSRVLCMKMQGNFCTFKLFSTWQKNNT